MPYPCKAGGGGANPKESVAVIKTSEDTSVGAIFVCRDFSLFRRLRCFLLRRGSIATRNQAENSTSATRDKGGQREQTVTARGQRHRATAIPRERTESLPCQCPQGPQGAAHRRRLSPPVKPQRASPGSLARRSAAVAARPLRSSPSRSEAGAVIQHPAHAEIGDRETMDRNEGRPRSFHKPRPSRPQTQQRDAPPGYQPEHGTGAEHRPRSLRRPRAQFRSLDHRAG
jgi:hypothetical protein